jgi:hypothetical protein
LSTVALSIPCGRFVVANELVRRGTSVLAIGGRR